jgi:hypothetical protein
MVPMMRPFRSFRLTAVLVFLLGLAVALLAAIKRSSQSREEADDPPVPQATSETSTENQEDDLSQTLVKELTDSGWETDAAKAVIALNHEWFSIQREENPNGFDRQIILLRGLGKHGRLSRFLVDHPETAVLLTGMDDPLPIVESLEESAGDYDLVASCYVQHAAPKDAEALALALKANRTLICTLIRRGLIGAEVLFIFDRGDQAAEEYESWLREVLEAASGF